jgi:cyclohexanone monooxygenase
MVMSIEQHVEWVAETVSYLREHGKGRIEASAEAQEEWVSHANEVGNRTLFNSDRSAKSWYVGANVQGKPVGLLPYVGGVPLYKEKLDGATESGYAGFRIS